MASSTPAATIFPVSVEGAPRSCAGSREVSSPRLMPVNVTPDVTPTTSRDAGGSARPTVDTRETPDYLPQLIGNLPNSWNPMAEPGTPRLLRAINDRAVLELLLADG